MAGSPWVVDVTADNFDQQVVERSRERPVVIDFWAPWCGPCRALGPVLERLAAEKDGAFLLAKVNTDESPELAGAFQVSGIPAVFAVRDGKLIDRFEGLLPEEEVRRFIDRLLPSATEQQAAGALELEGRDPAAAEAAYRQLLAADPGNTAARVGLARVLLAADGREAEAAELLGPVDSGDDAEEAERLRTVIALREVSHADADLAAARSAVAANPDDAEARYRLGRVLAARGKYQPAMDELLAAAERDKALGGSAVRELLLKVFTVIGSRSPDADEYRRKLQNMLY
jgi:putative thioredoxin